MSTKNNTSPYVYEFETVFKRVKKETGIETQADLGNAVGVTQAAVSGWKTKNIWPVEWALCIGQKYNLLAEWLLNGTGPKRLSDITSNNRYLSIIECDVNSQNSRKLQSDLIKDLDTWVSEMLASEPDRADWIKHCIYDALPAFKEWRKRKESEDVDEEYYPQGKVA